MDELVGAGKREASRALETGTAAAPALETVAELDDGIAAATRKARSAIQHEAVSRR